MDIFLNVFPLTESSEHLIQLLQTLDTPWDFMLLQTAWRLSFGLFLVIKTASYSRLTSGYTSLNVSVRAASSRRGWQKSQSADPLFKQGEEGQLMLTTLANDHADTQPGRAAFRVSWHACSFFEVKSREDKAHIFDCLTWKSAQKLPAEKDRVLKLIKHLKPFMYVWGKIPMNFKNRPV